MIILEETEFAKEQVIHLCYEVGGQKDRYCCSYDAFALEIVKLFAVSAIGKGLLDFVFAV